MLKLAKIDHVLRPTLNKVFSAKLFTAIYSRGRNSFVESLTTSLKEAIPGDHNPTEALGLTFRNDLGNAAGLDKDGSLLEFHYKIGAGFALVGTVLNKPHTGNLSPFYGKDSNPWTPLPNSHSALNSLGLPSKGIDATVKNIRAFKDQFQAKDFPVGVSIMGHPLQEGEEKMNGILECVEKVLPYADFIEINESCPNVQHHSNDGLKERLTRIKAISGNTPVLVKMGDLGNVEETLKLVKEVGLAGVVGLNTQKDYDYYKDKLNPSDRKLFDFYTENYQGGLSGQIIRERSFKQMEEAHKINKKLNLGLTLIHVGGISNAKDVFESRKSAPLREWYTGFMEALCTKDIDKIYQEMTSK